MGENYSEDNPYRILVDKYEALLKIQQKHNAFSPMVPSVNNNINNSNNGNKDGQNKGISLHEELQMSGQFSSFNGNASDSDDSSDDEGLQTKGRAAQSGGATCKYSETETTSSSGFSDETSNKCTQTETFFTGSFLCTISDGDDCRFSIYDDASPVESRFRKTPEYRQLFREIFAVLKRAAEAKDEGERLPLLQDDDDRGYEGEDGGDGADDTPSVGRSTASASGTPRVPPATPACEHNPLMSSVEQSATDERRPATPPPQTLADQQQTAEHQQKRAEQQQQQRSDVAEQQQQQQQESRPEARRHRRDIIEELASTIKHKKHVRHRKSSAANHQSKDISHLLNFKWTDQVTRLQPRSGSNERPPSSHRSTWCAVPDSAEASPAAITQPFASAASQEVAKLKLLDRSYAEALRRRKPLPTSSNRPQSQYINRNAH